MPDLHYGDLVISLREGESVLEALLRREQKIPHSCRAGACQSCVLRSTTPPPASAQLGLKETQRQQRYFFACMYRPDSDLTIDLDATPKEIAAVVESKEMLSEDVLCLRLRPEERLSYQAGQFIQLRREDGLTRSYSLASQPDDDLLVLHIRILSNGRMSRWMRDTLEIGEQMFIRGPSGDCFYTEGNHAQPLLLIGTGTGLAPLYGILQAALRAGHTGPIYLIHGALSRSGLYLQDELSALAAMHRNIVYDRCVLHGDPSEGVWAGDLKQHLKSRIRSLKGVRCFICGDPDMVKDLKKISFLAGAAMKEIFADAFILSPS
jgi:CDP-4-dehydro-6-deoxyglucose reductase